MAKGFEYFSRLIRNAKEANANNSLPPPHPSAANGEEGYDSNATLLQLRDMRGGEGRGGAGAKVEVEVEVVEEVPLTTVAHKLFNRWIGSGLWDETRVGPRFVPHWRRNATQSKRSRGCNQQAVGGGRGVRGSGAGVSWIMSYAYACVQVFASDLWRRRRRRRRRWLQLKIINVLGR